jgi:hypothetical protein
VTDAEWVFLLMGGVCTFTGFVGGLLWSGPIRERRGRAVTSPVRSVRYLCQRCGRSYAARDGGVLVADELTVLFDPAVPPCTVCAPWAAHRVSTGRAVPWGEW